MEQNLRPPGANQFISALIQLTARMQSEHKTASMIDVLRAEVSALGLTFFLAITDPANKDLVGRYSSINPKKLAVLERAFGVTLHNFRVSQKTWALDERITSGEAFFVADPVQWIANVFPKIPKSIIRLIIKQIGITPESPAVMASVVVEAQLVGIFTVWGSQIRPEDTTIISILANQVAATFEKNRLIEKLNKRLQEQIALRQATAIITSSLNLETVLRRIAEQLTQVVNTRGTYICDLNLETRAASVIAEYTHTHSEIRKNAPEDAFFRKEFIESLMVNRFQVARIDDPNLRKSVKEQLQQVGANSALYIPLQIKDQMIGFAVLWDDQAQREFSSGEIALCQSIALQAAIAIENARLYEQAQEVIAERLLAEQEVKVSLIEKEVLLKEIHHRVKNNMQVIISLLDLQSRQFDDSRIEVVFQECKNRVHSMALVHDKLYQSKNLSEINFADYIHNLVADLFKTYQVESKGIKLALHTEYFNLDIESAIPCALIVNELVSNALKHAFPGNRKGVITIDLALSLDNKILLAVSDDGVGMPPGFEIYKADTLGLQLVQALSAQINASLQIKGHPGTIVTLQFPRMAHNEIQ